MKEVRFSPTAEARLTDILEHSIKRWGLKRAEEYKKRLLQRVRSVARGELPHPRPCEALMHGQRDAAGLCYCREQSHYIVLRELDDRVEVVDFIHQSRDLERLIDKLSGARRDKR